MTGEAAVTAAEPRPSLGRRLSALVSRPAERIRPSSQGAGVSIAIRGLRQSLEGQTILSDIDLDVAPGEFVTLLGASGSGKTTLLMALAGFSLPDRGEILIDGEDVTGLQPHRRNIGIVFQNYALFPHLSVGQNIAYPLRLRGVGRGEIAARVRQALALVRLPDFESRAVASLSGGQRQRVAVARAIVFRPRVLLMDEPLSALDKPLREALQIELRRLHADLGLTTVYVTHDQREALTLSDRIAVMHAGRIAQVGTPQQLYERPQSAFVARFIGDSTILPVDLGPDGARIAGRAVALRHERPAGPCGLLLRPERLRIVTADRPAGPDDIVFGGSVSDVIYEGDRTRVQVRLPDDVELAIRDASSGQASGLPYRGQSVDVALRPEDAILVALDA